MTSETIDQYQILRTAAVIMRKTCQTPPNFPGDRSRATTTQALLCATLWAITFASNPLQSSAETRPTVCGGKDEVSLQLDDSWGKISVAHPSVLCAFRRKIGGFPTATITEESRVSSHGTESDFWRAESIVQSYHQVGLTDARISEARTVTSQGQRTFLAVVSYTNLGTNMTAIIAIADGSSRTFTLTLLDTSERFLTSKTQLEGIASSFRIDDQSLPSPKTSEPSSALPWWGIVSVVALLVGAVAGLVAKRR